MCPDVTSFFNMKIYSLPPLFLFWNDVYSDNVDFHPSLLLTPAFPQMGLFFNRKGNRDQVWQDVKIVPLETDWVQQYFCLYRTLIFICLSHLFRQWHPTSYCCITWRDLHFFSVQLTYVLRTVSNIKKIELSETANYYCTVWDLRTQNK